MSLPLSPILDSPEESLPALPKDIEETIDESVVRFESKFGLMLSWARSQGWVEEYRKELCRIARMSLERS